MTATDVLGLTHLGQATNLPSSPDTALLDCVPSGQSGTACVVRFTAPEFTSLFPMTGRPDFAHLVIDHIPRVWLGESKSLNPFLHSFRLDRECHRS